MTCRLRVLVLMCLMLAAPWGRAGMRETLEAIQGSEFRFMRSESEVPFMPLGWFQESLYPRTTLSDPSGLNPGGAVVESTLSLGAVLPAYVARRDLVALGADLAWDSITMSSGPYADQSVLRLTPVGAWLHQWGEEDLLGVFVAPIFSRELLHDGPWGCNAYGGAIGIHWFSDQVQLLYGGVYQYDYGQHRGYPYLGLQWLVAPRCSVSLVFPWPSALYSLSDRWFVSVGLTPGGSSWVRNGEGFESVESLGSWNLTAGAGYRFHDRFWAYAGAGLAGLRGLEIESDSHRTRFESEPGPVFTLAIQFRP